MNALALSFRNAVRSLSRRPTYFVVATISMALALGICAAAFALIDTVSNPRLAYADPDRVLVIRPTGGDAATGTMPREHAEGVRQLAEFDAVARADAGAKATIQIRDNTDNRAIARVTPDFFRTLGVTPEHGRDFNTGDADAGNVAIVSSSFWRRWFRGVNLRDAFITVGAANYAIVGVVSTSVRVPRNEVEVWTPMPAGEAPTGPGVVVAHIREGVSLGRARNVVGTVAARLTATQSPSAPFTTAITSLRPERIRSGFAGFQLLIPAFVLLIACANLAALTLARAVTEQRNHALRLALGARLHSLILDQLAEVALIAVAGGALGLLIGEYLAVAFTAGMPSNFAGPAVIFDPHISWRAVVFVFGAIVVSMVLTTLMPAAQLALIQPAAPLKGSSGTTTVRAMTSLRHIVFFEVVLTMMLLVVASLTLRGAERHDGIDRGFDGRPLRTVYGLVMPADSGVFGLAGLEPALLARFRAIPGVESATAFTFESGFGARPDSVHSEHTLAANRAMKDAMRITAGAHILATMRAPLLRGRDFDEADERGPGAAILDERAARVLFGDRDALGQLIQIKDPHGPRAARRWVPVVGIARATHAYYWYDVEDKASGTVFIARGQAHARQASVLLRIDDRRVATVAAIQRTLQTTVPARSVTVFAKFNDAFDADGRALQFLTRTIGFVALSGLALAAIGIFGVVSYAVGQRMREFAVRVALGAQSSSIVRLVLRDGLLMSVGGTAIGALLGVGFGVVIRSMLYGVEPTDALSLLRSGMLLAMVAGAACLIPALRATRANPLDVIRAT